MKAANAIPLQDFLCSLARSAVDVQRVLDAGFDQERDQFITQAARLGAVPSPYLEAVAPRRLLVRTFELQCQVRFSSEKSRGFEVGAVPLNASYHARYSTRTTRESVLHLFIERMPLPDTSSQSNNQKQ